MSTDWETDPEHIIWCCLGVGQDTCLPKTASKQVAEGSPFTTITHVGQSSGRGRHPRRRPQSLATHPIAGDLFSAGQRVLGFNPQAFKPTEQKDTNPDFCIFRPLLKRPLLLGEPTSPKVGNTGNSKKTNMQRCRPQSLQMLPMLASPFLFKLKQHVP